MKKIGFIEYYLNEWHANNYPDLIEKASNGEFKVCYAYAHGENPKGGMTNKEWAELHNVELLDTMEEVIEKSDCLVVLSPDNPELHELLCEKPLQSGKPVYVDKTFAPDKETALRIFANADKHNTKCFSSSALRFATEWQEMPREGIYKIFSEGPGTLEVYSIHQIEPVIHLMNARAQRLMFLGDEKHPSYIVQFADGRLAQMSHRVDEKKTFAMTIVDADNKAVRHEVKSNYFGLFIDAMIRFFETGEVPVSHEQTVDVIAVRAAAIQACKTPFRWIEL